MTSSFGSTHGSAAGSGYPPFAGRIIESMNRVGRFMTVGSKGEKVQVLASLVAAAQRRDERGHSPRNMARKF